jgi:hypothetical protein
MLLKRIGGGQPQMGANNDSGSVLGDKDVVDNNNGPEDGWRASVDD